MTLQAFHNDPQLKAALLAEVEKHRLADAIISGIYGAERNGHFVGCAVGCSIESLNRLQGRKFSTGNHSAYPELVGVPQWLARLQDTLFEGMPEARRPLWPGQFWQAIRPGADLETVKAPFLIFVLESALTNLDHAKFPDVLTAINWVITLHQSGGSPEDFARAAHAVDAADAAVDAAHAVDAADAAVDAAYAADAADAAAHAAYAADAAAHAADAAYAAAHAAYAADAADAADAAYAAAHSKFADKLLELMAAKHEVYKPLPAHAASEEE